MNNIRQIQELNKKELENGVSPEASWHTDYRDTAYVYIGGLPFELSEGDIVTIFSQYGEPTYINLVRDKETGKSRGFAFLKYEDQRSTDLAVDNLGGTVVMGRTLRVDHTRYKKKDDEKETGIDLTKDLEQIDDEDGESRRKRRRTSESESEEERPMLREEIELAKLIQNHDDEDPMKAYLVQEKKEEVALALAKVKKGGKKSEKSHKHKHRHHESTRDEEGERDRERKSSHRDERRRSRSRDRPSAKDIDSKSRSRNRSQSVDGRRDDHRSRRRESPRRNDRDRDDGRDRRRRHETRDELRDDLSRSRRRS